MTCARVRRRSGRRDGHGSTAASPRRRGRLWIGLVFACATALATNLAFLWKHRGAVAAPAIDIRRPVGSATELQSKPCR